ncbi:MAG: PIN domain nuclease [Actinomycetota bacterium]
MLVHGARSRAGRLRARVADSRESLPRGRLVEFVRLIFVLLFTVAGFTIGTRLPDQDTTKTIMAVVLGSSTGFVLGGVLGRQTAAAVRTVEEDLRRVPAAEIVAGLVGLIIGLAIAALVSVPVFRLPPLAAWTSVAFTYVTMAFVGFRVGRTKTDELFGLIGLKPRAAGVSRGEVSVIDTSALIDGRVLDLVKTGFLSGDLLVHTAVLRELQAVADSSDPKRRARGRRGLDTVAELGRAATVDVHLVEEDGVPDVDSALVALARDRGASLITTDHNLAKVVQALSVPVPALNDLAEAFRLPVVPGDLLLVELVKDGREYGQAVGYLEDGTMVVVEAARESIGSEVGVLVRNVIKTATGRMVFANLQ